MSDDIVNEKSNLDSVALDVIATTMNTMRMSKQFNPNDTKLQIFPTWVGPMFFIKLKHPSPNSLIPIPLPSKEEDAKFLLRKISEDPTKKAMMDSAFVVNQVKLNDPDGNEADALLIEGYSKNTEVRFYSLFKVDNELNDIFFGEIYDLSEDESSRGILMDTIF